MYCGEDPRVDRVILELVSSSKILSSQQTSFGTLRPIERSGQHYDPHLVPEIDDDDDDDDDDVVRKRWLIFHFFPNIIGRHVWSNVVACRTGHSTPPPHVGPIFKGENT